MVLFKKIRERIFGHKPKVCIGHVTLKAPGGNHIEIVVGGHDPIQTAQVTNQIRYWFKVQRTNAGVDLPRFEQNMRVFEEVMATLDKTMSGVFKGVFKNTL